MEFTRFSILNSITILLEIQTNLWFGQTQNSFGRTLHPDAYVSSFTLHPRRINFDKYQFFMEQLWWFAMQIGEMTYLMHICRYVHISIYYIVRRVIPTQTCQNIEFLLFLNIKLIFRVKQWWEKYSWIFKFYVSKNYMY